MKLIPIRMSKRNGCEHPDIKSRRTYIVKVYGDLCLGTFSKQWYGWSFDGWGMSGIQLDSGGVEKIWELKK